MKKLVIFGCGGHAREVAQMVDDINQKQPDCWQLEGFLHDPQATALHPKPLPAPVLGHPQWLAAHPETQLVVAVGDPTGRSQVVQRLLQIQPALHFATLIHPRAWVAQRAIVGEGSVVFANALINADVTIGTHAIINLGCSISHDSVLGDFVSFGPGVHLGGACQIETHAELGVGVIVRPRSHIGKHSTVGAGSVVVKNVPSDCIAVGVPAKPLPVKVKAC